VYCAELIAGGFYFGIGNKFSQTVFRNNRGNGYRNTVELNMDRPEDGTSEADAWDAVFETCPALNTKSPTEIIEHLWVSDQWGISNSGAKSTGTAGSPVLVSFRNAHSLLYPEIEVDLHLRGQLPDVCPPCIPEEGAADLEIYLDDFWFYVHAHGNDSCKITSTFQDWGVESSKLRMSWGACN